MELITHELLSNEDVRLVTCLSCDVGTPEMHTDEQIQAHLLVKPKHTVAVMESKQRLTTVHRSFERPPQTDQPE